MSDQAMQDLFKRLEETAPLPPDEESRLTALWRYDVLDTVPDRELDRLTEVAAAICGVPRAVISLVDRGRQWFKSRIGVEDTETPRCISFCQYTILGDDVFEVPDARKDERFRMSPLVTHDPFIRFYAGAPLKTPDGFRIGALCVIDSEPGALTTDQRRLLRVLADEVMNRFELRVTNKHLQEARCAAEQALKARDHFLSVISHEIRNPLSAVTGLADMLLSSDPHPNQLESLRSLRFAGENLAALVADVLDARKIDEDRIEFQRVVFSPSEVGVRLVELYRAAASAKGLTLEFVAGEGLPTTVLGDTTRLTQVLGNILHNAVKFTEEGGIVLRVDLAPSTEPNERSSMTELVFSVRDSGIGIEEQYLDAVFESYGQGPAETAERYGGTGLGLAVGKRLVELQGGHIEVSSRPGEGTVFRVKLPFALPDAVHELEGEKVTTDKDAPAGGTDADGAAGASVGLGDLSAQRVVIVEDDALVMRVLRHHFERAGAVCIGARSGKEARAVLTDAVGQQSPAVALIDLHLPDHDGFEILREFTLKLPSTSHVIAMSASGSCRDKEAAISAGADAFLDKPFTESSLRVALQL